MRTILDSVEVILILAGVAIACVLLVHGVRDLRKQRAQGIRVQWFKHGTILLSIGLLFYIASSISDLLVHFFTGKKVIPSDDFFLFLPLIPMICALIVFSYTLYLNRSKFRR